VLGSFPLFGPAVLNTPCPTCFEILRSVHAVETFARRGRPPRRRARRAERV